VVGLKRKILVFGFLRHSFSNTIKLLAKIYEIDNISQFPGEGIFCFNPSSTVGQRTADPYNKKEQATLNL
jgi:hypothetical protein